VDYEQRLSSLISAQIYIRFVFANSLSRTNKSGVSMADKFAESAVAQVKCGRELGLDLVRVTAMLMVVMLHVAGEGFYTQGSDWYVVNLYDSICRASVPLFFILSGCLIIPKNISIHDVVRRAFKLAVPLFFWSLVFIFLMRETDLGRMKSAGVELSISQIFAGPVLNHLWFLYTLIGLYLFSPVLSVFFRFAQNSLKFFYIGTVFFGSSLLPFFHDITAINWLGVDFLFFPIYAGYMFLGALLSHWIPLTRTSIMFLAAGVGAGVGTAAITLWATHRAGHPVETFYAYSSPFAAFAATLLFLGLRGLGNYLSDSLIEKAIVRLAPLTFGTFILHFPVLVYLMDLGLNYSAGGVLVGIPLATAVVFLVTSALVAGIRTTAVGRTLCPA